MMPPSTWFLAGSAWQVAHLASLKTTCRSASDFCMFSSRSWSPMAGWFTAKALTGAGPPVTLTLTMSALTPADDSTVTDLVIVPDLPRRSIETSIGPLVPGAMGQGVAGSFANVQPHEVRTPLIITSASDVFVNQNV